jgi:hypothetical protein
VHLLLAAHRFCGVLQEEGVILFLSENKFAEEMCQKIFHQILGPN